MKLTVSTAVSDRPVEEKGFLAWVNGEATKLLRQFRAFANYLSWDRQTCTTAGDGAFVRIWESDPLPTNAVIQVEARVTGISTSGSFVAADYLRVHTVYSNAGSVSELGGTANVMTHESDALCDCHIARDATNRTAYVQVRDNASSPMRWVAVVSVSEVLPA